MGVSNKLRMICDESRFVANHPRVICDLITRDRDTCSTKNRTANYPYTPTKVHRTSRAITIQSISCALSQPCAAAKLCRMRSMDIKRIHNKKKKIKTFPAACTTHLLLHPIIFLTHHSLFMVPWQPLPTSRSTGCVSVSAICHHWKAVFLIELRC